MAKISIIIPCFNQGQFISDALGSVFDQTYDDWEIIIVNDGSTDEFTREILGNIQNPKVQVIDIKNSGLPTARNIGIKHSVGDYILPLDADDKIHPSYLSKALDILDNHPSISIVYSQAEFFGNLTGTYELPNYELSLMLKQNLIFCSAIFRRDLFNQTTGYNLNMKYGWEDWDLWLSFIELGANICRINEIMFYYRKHKSSMVNEISINISKRQYLERQLIKNHINLYVEHFKEPLTLLRELDSLKSDQESFERWKHEIIHSLDYKIGNYFLRPIRFINKLFLNRKK